MHLTCTAGALCPPTQLLRLPHGRRCRVRPLGLGSEWTRPPQDGGPWASPGPWARQRGARCFGGCERSSVSRLLLRDCVHTLHSRDTWLKQARVVRLGEVPYKVRAAGREAAAPRGRARAWARGRAGPESSPPTPGMCLRPWGQICVPCVFREARALLSVDMPTPALCGLC